MLILCQAPPQEELFCNRQFVRKSEAKCEAIDLKTIFYPHANKTHLYKEGFALSLVLKVSVCVTRKRPIGRWFSGAEINGLFSLYIFVFPFQPLQTTRCYPRELFFCFQISSYKRVSACICVHNLIPLRTSSKLVKQLLSIVESHAHYRLPTHEKLPRTDISSKTNRLSDPLNTYVLILLTFSGCK